LVELRRAVLVDDTPHDSEFASPPRASCGVQSHAPTQSLSSEGGSWSNLHATNLYQNATSGLRSVPTSALIFDSDAAEYVSS